MARLTKNFFRFNFNDYFNFKNFFFNKNNLINFLNFNELNENFYQNYYYLFFKNKKSLLTNNRIMFQLKQPIATETVRTFMYKAKKNNFNFAKALNNFNIFNKFELILLFFFKSFFNKYIFFNVNTLNKNNILKNKISNFLTFFKDFFFYSKKNIFFLNNLIPDNNFNYVIKKKILKIFNYCKFPTITIFLHYFSLVRFIEFCSGKKVLLKFFNFIVNKLNFNEKAQCLI